jgi:NADH-quinone oxidoreductase subunit I
VARGLVVTIGHLLRNLFHQGDMPTVQYPEQSKPLPVRIKARHRLTLREDGSPKCVACYMCQTACPARCIHIVAEESPDPTIEKRPLVFDIDLLRCVFCGYCVEACPEDAIRMDTGEVSIVGDKREDFIFHMDFLLRGSVEEHHKYYPAPASEDGPPPLSPPPPPDTPEETTEGDVRSTRPPVPASW